MASLVSFTLPSDPQAIDERFWKRYRNMADSLVISRLGKDVFKRYVFTESQVHHDLSDLIFLTGDSVLAWTDRGMVKTCPLYCFFEYEICLNKREGGSTIRFALDPSGRLVEAEPTNGLVPEQTGRNGFAMSIAAFEHTARDNGFHWDRSDRFRSLEWVVKDSLGSLYPSETYELTIGRHIGEGFEIGVGCTYLFDIIEGIRFDAFTGKVLAKGIFQVPSGVTTRATQL